MTDVKTLVSYVLSNDELPYGSSFLLIFRCLLVAAFWQIVVHVNKLLLSNQELQEAVQKCTGLSK